MKITDVSGIIGGVKMKLIYNSAYLTTTKIHHNQI